MIAELYLFAWLSVTSKPSAERKGTVNESAGESDVSTLGASDGSGRYFISKASEKPEKLASKSGFRKLRVFGNHSSRFYGERDASQNLERVYGRRLHE
ncbi:hypothetical protein MTO96_015223 [Rhipicephalus appendiculatus]